MSDAERDTIAAVATAPGRGALGILRLSGPQALSIAESIAGPLPAPRRVALRAFRDADGQQLDRGLLICFPGPASYTGEDIAELQGHGSPVLLDLLLRAACAQGARIARPGEFSERAFLNGRLDLAQAEAVASLIDAGSRAAVLAANRSLDGELSRRVHQLVEQVIAVRVYVEGALDFSDEDIDWLADASLSSRMNDLLQGLQALRSQADQGRRLSEGLVVVIAGQPNAGKSTLLNRLSGTEAAIVTPIAGTTRDLLREQILLDGLPLTVIDTAGLRETDDPVEQEGVRRARHAIARADLLLYLFDDRAGLQQADRALLNELPALLPRLLLANKCDLSGRPPALVADSFDSTLRFSAKAELGMDLLKQEIRRLAGVTDAGQASFSARSRHVQALEQAETHLRKAQGLLAQRIAVELVAEELRLAQQSLAEITGEFSSDDLLGRIFSSFCIGK